MRISIQNPLFYEKDSGLFTCRFKVLHAKFKSTTPKTKKVQAFINAWALDIFHFGGGWWILS